jgi:3'(2'), 5'-bisphosphate nucleotidase
MDFTQLPDVLKTAKYLAGEASKEILGVYAKDFSVYFKEDASPLTEADRKSNELIVSALRGKYPECAILAEESEDRPDRLNNDWCFIIDPLDGTKEFVKKNDEFTINIALSYKGKPVLGVIHIPVTGEIYYAVKGMGAYYEKDGKREKITVSSRIKDIRMVRSLSHKSKRLDELIEKNGIKNVKAVGSAIKGCLVAKGEAE